MMEAAGVVLLALLMCVAAFAGAWFAVRESMARFDRAVQEARLYLMTEGDE